MSWIVDRYLNTMGDLEQILDVGRGSISLTSYNFPVLRLLNPSDVPQNIPTNF